MSRVSIIIVSYNVRYYLEQCLRSVARASAGLDVETIVVDNDSSDGSVEYLEPLFPTIKFIRAGGNLGFSKANNIGFGQSSGNYVLFLNPDTVISENVLADCIRFMDNHKEAGAAGVRMLNRDGSFARESKRGVPTPFVSFCKMSGLCRLFPKSRIFGRYYLGHLDPDEANRIEIISGAFMFVRREALEAVGGFDEDFFMYGEDIDLSYRILKQGYENWYIPVTILHYKGESTNKTTYRYAKVFYNAMLIFFNKHFRKYSILFSLFVKAVISVQTVLSFLLNRVIYRSRSKGTDRLVWMYSGHEQHLDQVARLAGVPRKDIISCGMSLPGNDIPRDYTIYDVSVFAYSEILQNMSDCKGVARIATYNPENGMFISNAKILRDENKS